MKYLKMYIGSDEVELDDLDSLPISFNYLLEDSENFQSKKGNESFNITVPATLINDKIFNTFHNPAVEDLTTGNIFRGHRPCKILGNGYELLVGKAFLVGATHNDKPQSYKMNCYGGNADWMIDLKETTLYELLQNLSFVFDKPTIEASWAFNGMLESLPYVFAPVKYGNWLDDVLFNENNITVTSMKPSLSVYWILYWGFKSVGYKIDSQFFNTAYFRRLVMPWVWGNFLSSEGTKYEIHKFRARSTSSYYATGGMTTPQWLDVKCSNDSTNGMFDNNNTVVNGDYQWLPGNNYEMQWKYNTPNYGVLDATLSIDVSVNLKVTNNSNGDVWVHWFKNGVQMFVEHIAHAQAPYVTIGGPTTDTGIKTSFFTVTVVNGDTISCRIRGRRFESKTGYTHMEVGVEQFQLDYFRIPLGGTIQFDAYNGFKKIKFLDLLRGIIDTFNISVSTDATNKVVLMEPSHSSIYSQGFFNGDFIDWNDKQDLSKISDLELFSDYEREVLFRFKEDQNDGLFKLIQDRYQTKLATGKYVFPDRFKAGKKEFENRFFTSVMHYEAEQFKAITNVAPQLVCIVPENISNTSRSEAQNTFAPKLCWYKGEVSGVGGWTFEGQNKFTLPYMFAVNYKQGGQNDPILSYSDEKIGSVTGSEVLGIGLLKRFFWQRLAIMRNGQYYNTYFQLNNNDASKPHHREHKIVKGQKWELVQINDYQPLADQSTKCFLRKWVPVSVEDFNATYPTQNSVLNDNLTGSTYDIKYSQLKCLANDIPTPE
ncbi:MAG: hypothetical protein LC112_13995 [Flavobacteriales bacterium]|nr:hypothetical protein [Flavobacteriales bacterium]